MVQKFWRPPEGHAWNKREFGERREGIHEPQSKRMTKR